jgi:putative ABC transport system permease protein
VDKLQPLLGKEGMNYDTIETEKEKHRQVLWRPYPFSCTGWIYCFVIGCVGVASSIHVYVQEKISSIAIMRCLGARASQAFLIYLVQITAIGFIGSLIGAILGCFYTTCFAGSVQRFPAL